MTRIILHIDMDAYYASLESRDRPELKGKPLIIGALPHERGVVSTCSYEARVYGIRSAMNIKEAYRRCPHGIFLRPDMEKYAKVSGQLHEIWNDYTDVVEYLSLDEGYLDLTGSLRMFGSARAVAAQIKARTRTELGLTCSIGAGYSMAAAKLASEEMKPDGYFEILSAADYRRLILDRDVRVIWGVGQKTAEKLYRSGIHTVRELLQREADVVLLLGNHGHQILELAQGIDRRRVTPWYESEAKSIGREQTFQQDTEDQALILSQLKLFSRALSQRLREEGLWCRTVTLKLTYANMRQITRARSGPPTDQADEIYQAARALLAQTERQPIRLIGISLSHFSAQADRQITFEDLLKPDQQQKTQLDQVFFSLQKRFGSDIIKTAAELEAEQYLESREPEEPLML